MYIEIGKRVQHKLHTSIHGTVIGYGTIANPWSHKTHGVYLVAMDDPVQVGKLGISIQVWEPRHVVEDNSSEPHIKPAPTPDIPPRRPAGW